MLEYKNYKYPFNAVLKKKIKEIICAFLNTKGGRLYIGIEDITNKIIGVTMNVK